MMNDRDDRWSAKLLIGFSLLASGFVIWVSAQRALSYLEAALLQVLSLFAGLAGSYIFGVRSAKASAGEVIKPHARSAFRRVLSLYQSLSRLAESIARSQAERSETSGADLRELKAIVIEQISAAGDALEDWRDIVPEEVKAVLDQVGIPRQVEEKGDV